MIPHAQVTKSATRWRVSKWTIVSSPEKADIKLVALAEKKALLGWNSL